MQKFLNTTLKRTVKPAFLAYRNFNNLAIEEKEYDTHYIRLNRPSHRNAFNAEVISEITEAFNEAASLKARSVVLTGNGVAFSAGADLNWMKQMAEYSEEENFKDAQNLFEAMYSIWKCPIPVIARVNGDAFGGGLGLIAACDMAFSVRNCMFAFSECKLGLIPAVISPFVISKTGLWPVSRYFLTAERFRVPEAQDIGLIHDAFETEAELDACIKNITKEVATNSPAATRECKKLIRNVGQDLDPIRFRDEVCKAIATIRVSAEGQEGLKSFLQKRKPSWLK